MSLSDFLGGAGADDTVTYDIKIPDVDDFDKQTRLAFEKEVTGAYITGHPLEEYEKLWEDNITAKSIDFRREEEDVPIRLADGSLQTIGGLISDINVRQTRKGDTMATITIEDLLGSVEVIVWPKTYYEKKGILAEDEKVFVKGRVKAEEEKDGQLLADDIWLFEDAPKKLFIRYEDLEAYEKGKNELFSVLKGKKGNDTVIIYLGKEKKQKPLREKIDLKSLKQTLQEMLGEENVKEGSNGRK